MRRSDRNKKELSEKNEQLTIKLGLVLVILSIIDKLLEIVLKMLK